ncbi:MAG: hypothetical protein GY749_13490 [Desulfobacteraceae bacterium]|nr:hypothetical protein [Desulfobacteraceae bacterium]
MKTTGRYCAVSNTDKDAEMQNEIYEQLRYLKRYTNNIDSLFDKNRSNEVKKAIINFLVEQL